MKAREIAEHLAAAAAHFPLLGKITASNLMALVRSELGHEEALDDFKLSGQHYCKAIGPERILHVMSGNTPHASLQSVMRGLLLGAHNFCKIPSAGLVEIDQFRSKLPTELAARVEIAPDLSESWIDSADAVIVFGSDETIGALKARVRPHQRFIPHGHKISFGVVFADTDFSSVNAAAADASAFDQLGCLSPHVFYVADRPEKYAERLAGAMDAFNRSSPRRKLPTDESAQISAARQDWRFRAASGEKVKIWESAGSTEWTVVFSEAPGFTASCLNRFVIVKPFPLDWRAELAAVQPHLSACGIFPATLENARQLAGSGLSRLCPLGAMQTPPVSWHQDGMQVLAPLVRWVDFDKSELEK